VQIVFDTSAVMGYARGDIAPGELVMVVGEEDGTVGLPATCLAEAYAAAEGGEEDRLEYVSTAVPTVEVLPLAPMDAPAVGRLSRQASLGIAHAALVSSRLGIYLATLQGAAVRRLGMANIKIIDL